MHWPIDIEEHVFYIFHNIYFPPKRLVNKTLHASCPSPAPMSNFRTQCGPPVRKFFHPCFREKSCHSSAAAVTSVFKCSFSFRHSRQKTIIKSETWRYAGCWQVLWWALSGSFDQRQPAIKFWQCLKCGLIVSQWDRCCCDHVNKLAARCDATRDVLFLQADVSHAHSGSCHAVHSEFKYTDFMSYAGLLEPTYLIEIHLSMDWDAANSKIRN